MLLRFRRAALAASACLAATSAPALADIDVVVSIKPIHSLVAGVMEGIGSPHLVVRDAGSPHTYSLKPSDAKALEGADVVFWVGEELETFLESSIETLAQDARVVALVESGGLELLAYREGGPWAAHAHGDEGHEHEAEEHGHDDEHADHEAGEQHGGHAEHAANDMHLWLDPHNAMVIVQQVARVLGEDDPDNKAGYEANARAVLAELEALDTEIEAALKPVSSVPFIVFHDAYQYMEHRYGLNAVGSVTVGPDRQPGAERLHELRETLRERGAQCAFAEPQFRPALIDTIVEGTGADVAVLDPLGADLEDGPDLYFTLMRNNARALGGCLSGSS